ncbi:hypothetical protein ACIQX0_21550 [Methylobacterium sp. NPDC097213]|uniref:hypothetical protein n=1 Tax=unclassified Methylobacterium TaxID=2615210 RepID=UPI00383ACD08
MTLRACSLQASPESKRRPNSFIATMPDPFPLGDADGHAINGSPAPGGCFPDVRVLNPNPIDFSDTV